MCTLEFSCLLHLHKNYDVIKNGIIFINKKYYKDYVVWVPAVALNSIFHNFYDSFMWKVRTVLKFPR